MKPTTQLTLAVLGFVMSSGTIQALLVIGESSQPVPQAIAQTSQAADTESIIRARVEQWEAAWNVGTETFSMARFDDLYVQDETLLAYDLTSPETPTILRGYQQYAETWEPFMQAFFPWNVSINDDLEIRAGEQISVATFTWQFEGAVKANGQPISGELHATLVFENRDGIWQIVHEHISTPVRDSVNTVERRTP